MLKELRGKVSKEHRTSVSAIGFVPKCPQKDNPYKLSMVRFLEQKTTFGRVFKKALKWLIACPSG